MDSKTQGKTVQPANDDKQQVNNNTIDSVIPNIIAAKMDRSR